MIVLRVYHGGYILIAENFWKGPMGARLTICCRYYLNHSKEEKSAILR